MKKEKEIKNQKKIIKPEKRKKEKKHAQKAHPAALTDRPSIAPTRAELSSAPLTGGA
jgi:hypothetical protein